MTGKLKISPMNEPRGEGNGWHDCEDDVATAFYIEDEDGEIVESFEDRAAAEAYLSGEAAPKP